MHRWDRFRNAATSVLQPIIGWSAGPLALVAYTGHELIRYRAINSGPNPARSGNGSKPPNCARGLIHPAGKMGSHLWTKHSSEMRERPLLALKAYIR